MKLRLKRKTYPSVAQMTDSQLRYFAKIAEGAETGEIGYLAEKMVSRLAPRERTRRNYWLAFERIVDTGSVSGITLTFIKFNGVPCYFKLDPDFSWVAEDITDTRMFDVSYLQ